VKALNAFARRFSGPLGSFAVAAFVFLGATAFNKFHPFRFSQSDLIAGGVYALFAVSLVQVAARTRRPLQSYLLCAIVTAALFWLTCWSAVFDNTDGRYSAAIALTIWGGITLGLFIWVAYWEKTEPRNVNG